MRQAVVLVLALAAFAASFFYIWRQVTASNEAAVSPAALPSTAKPADAKETRAQKRSSKPAVHTNNPPSGEANAQQQATADASLKSRPKPATVFPTVADVPTGTARENLLATFGEPLLRASLYDRGEFQETFVYVNGDSKAATYARLLNGTVVSASTTVR